MDPAIVRSRVLGLLKRYGLTEKDCKRQITDKHLDLISRSCCKEWKSLPPYLDLETIEAEDICKNIADERGRRHGFLLKWKEIVGGSCATYEKLIKALVSINCADDAEKVCKILNPRQGCSSEATEATTSSEASTTSSEASTTSSEASTTAASASPSATPAGRETL